MSTIDLISKALDVATLRQDVISSNIANADTPGYKRAVVQFEEYLHTATEKAVRMDTTSEGHITGRKEGLPDPVVHTVRWTSMRRDGNNVDIEAEMSALLANNIRYSALTRGLSDYLTRYRTAIVGGR